MGDPGASSSAIDTHVAIRIVDRLRSAAVRDNTGRDKPAATAETVVQRP